MGPFCLPLLTMCLLNLLSLFETCPYLLTLRMFHQFCQSLSGMSDRFGHLLGIGPCFLLLIPSTFDLGPSLITDLGLRLFLLLVIGLDSACSDHLSDHLLSLFVLLLQF